MTHRQTLARALTGRGEGQKACRQPSCQLLGEGGFDETVEVRAPVVGTTGALTAAAGDGTEGLL